MPNSHNFTRTDASGCVSWIDVIFASHEIHHLFSDYSTSSYLSDHRILSVNLVLDAPFDPWHVRRKDKVDIAKFALSLHDIYALCSF